MMGIKKIAIFKLKNVSIVLPKKKYKNACKDKLGR
jgi:hypothetical protein